MLLNCYQQELIEAGCDEAGRGCLVGPVFAAAVILPKNFTCDILNDSKQVSIKQRNYLREKIEQEAISWAVASVDNEEIDRINILNASYLAMHKAINELNIRPQYLVIDGNRFKPFQDVPHACIVKGDGKFLNIAAASILAKTYRDDYMEKLSLEYPDYAWDKNKGYATAKHRTATLKFGFTPHHRRTFRVIDPQLDLFSK